MDRIEQRVMVKYFFLKGRGSKFVDGEGVSTLQDNTISLSAISYWLRRFKSGDRSCGGEERLGIHLISVGRLFSAL
jgi:hypothetical protein